MPGADEDFPLTPQLLLQAYAAGLFPMADSAEEEDLYWYDPPARGVIPLDEHFHVSRRLRRFLKSHPFEMRFDTAFRTVMEACAAPAPDRPQTWINGKILDLYTALHEMGHAHSVETWHDGKLVGGLYGVHLGAAFFGESMFSRETNASKVALVALVEKLRDGGFLLLDAQFITEHLKQFGAEEIPRADYHKRLKLSLQRRAVF